MKHTCKRHLASSAAAVVEEVPSSVPQRPSRAFCWAYMRHSGLLLLLCCC